MTITITQMNRPDAALAAAVHFLARRAPFDQFGFGMMTLSLDTQIKRRTYLFAIDDVKVVGYLGWTMLDTARAEAFARQNRTPRFDEIEGTDVVWVLIVAASAHSTVKAMIDTLARKYAGKRVMGVRYKSGGKKIIFDSVFRQGLR